jgi:hypothetical protein
MKKTLLAAPDIKHRHITLQGYEYSFKDLAQSIDSYVYRCKFRSACGALVHIHKDQFQNLVDSSEKIQLQEPELHMKFSLKGSHTCQNKILVSVSKKIIDAKLGIEVLKNYDLTQVRDTIAKDPLMSAKGHLTALKTKNFDLKLRDVQKILTEIRDEKFPKEKDLIFNKTFCLTKDPVVEKKQVFFQGRFLSPDTIQNSNTEIVILASRYMLNMLAQCQEWYCDGTFRTTPKGYMQLYNIIVYSSWTKMYSPGAYILMTRKTEQAYRLALGSLKLVAMNLGYKLAPLSIMCDFEKAPMKIFKEEFSESEIDSI